ncbi:Sorting nexin-32 [Schistosoma japonicum]|uniref:Sorting nexin-32 n=1 Tax=Schistosoma japonicum TaxID=6182 RepID=A0A4Z2DJG0_SCHJA|nr:Sorting nexin-32 [Schistosoma japonicum]
MEHISEHSTSIYHDTVSIGGGSSFPQFPSQIRGRSDAVDPSSESLVVEISGAMSDKDRVLFKIHTKTTLPDFKQNECTVQRMHEEFVWLHDHLVENDTYAGLIVPPVPLKPDFDASRAKLQRLGENEGNLPKEDLQKMKAELEAEYLATFKKTVAMHEVFLQRLASHPTFKHDHGFRVFLEFEEELNVRNKTRKEKAVDFLKSVSKSADETIWLNNQRDNDVFFREEKCSLSAADLASKCRKTIANTLLQTELALSNLIPKECNITPETDLTTLLTNFFESFQKILVRLSSDEDLKLSDTLRYYAIDTGAARALLYRRCRALADYEAANRNLDKARARMKDVQAAEDAQAAANERFKSISESAKLELEDFKVRRIKYFHKNLVDLAELEVKHAKSQIELIKSSLVRLKSIPMPDIKSPTTRQPAVRSNSNISVTNNNGNNNSSVHSISPTDSITNALG